MENKNNNFGFLRLLLATLVIFSHSPELLDGNSSREILTSIFGTISFGELAVDGFFLISGYLILKSFNNSVSIKSYLLKRCLRIYPAFIAATIISIFIVAPLSGGFDVLSNISHQQWWYSFGRAFTLKQPLIDGVFVNNHSHYLNGPMWTIKYEFICYLLIPLIFYLRFFNKKYFLAILLLIVSIVVIFVDLNIAYLNLQIARFCLLFLSGSCFYLYRDSIKWSLALTVVCLVCLLFCLSYNKYLANLGLSIFGGYLLFNFALNFKHSFINSIGSKTDISYGVYLYAWPIQSLTIQYYPTIEPYQLNVSTLCVVAPLAYLSYRFIEKPFMNLKHQIV
ncbi:MAG: acyltransferase [Methylotenera sp.]|nr:acyltransferase [Methylotenera sp.]